MSKSRRKPRVKVQVFMEGHEPYKATRPLFNANDSRAYAKSKKLRSRKRRRRNSKVTKEDSQ